MTEQRFLEIINIMISEGLLDKSMLSDRNYVTDALEFDTDDWADHLNYLDNALVKIQDMYEHDKW